MHVYLKPDERETFTYTFGNAPEGSVVSIRFDEGEWHDMERLNLNQARIQLAGPTAVPQSISVVLHLGKNRAEIKTIDGPDILIEDAGFVMVE